MKLQKNDPPLSWGDEQARLIREGRFDELDREEVCRWLNLRRGIVVLNTTDTAENMCFQMIKLAHIRANLEERIEILRGNLAFDFKVAGYTAKDIEQALAMAWTSAFTEFCRLNGLEWVHFPLQMPVGAKKMLKREFFPNLNMEDWLNRDQQEDLTGWLGDRNWY